jgi:hypothetical protein
MEKLASYIRNHRPSDMPLEYDRMIRLTLNWLDTHRIREKSVFLAQEGKEYAAMLHFLEERLGFRPEIEHELFELLVFQTIKQF